MHKASCTVPYKALPMALGNREQRILTLKMPHKIHSILQQNNNNIQVAGGDAVFQMMSYTSPEENRILYFLRFLFVLSLVFLLIVPSLSAT